MNLEDCLATSNDANVGGNGTGHGGVGDVFGVLVSAVEAAASGQVGPHDLAAALIIMPDVPAAPILCQMPLLFQIFLPFQIPFFQMLPWWLLMFWMSSLLR